MNGNKFGMGTYIYPNGDKYKGEFQDGKIHGKGLFIYHNGAKY